jgi:Phage integrase SAM-like domain
MQHVIRKKKKRGLWPKLVIRHGQALYQRSGSRFWWMSYTMHDERYFESAKTTSKDLATKIWKRREGEIALGLFKVGWAGERMTFGQLSEDFERSHFAGLAANTIRGHRMYLNNLKAFFGNHTLDKITVEMVEAYRDQRRRQPTKRKPNQTVKGATVNRELECLKCVLDLAFKRKYIPENPASTVKHFNELRERPVRRMLTLDEERRILEVAPPHLRVALIRLDNEVKLPGQLNRFPCLNMLAMF